jgi:hypothetical protein
MGRGTKARTRSIAAARGGFRRRGLPPFEARDLRYLLDPESEAREERARRRRLIASLILSPGEHFSIEEGCNAMEAVSYLAGEPWSSTPRCVSSVITTFLRRWNDDLSSDELRDRLLKPLIPTILDATRDPRHEEIWARMCADWVVREYAPTFLRLAGLQAWAEQLEALPSITGDERATEAESLCKP